MDELQGGYKVKNCKSPTKPSKDSSVVRYHGPYMDASGEKFYLPRKWHHGGTNWQECDVNYEFKKDEMCGMDLIKNLHWLGKSNQLMKLVDDDSSDEFEYDEANEEDTSESSSTELVGRGIHCHGVRKQKNVLDDEQNIQRAMPKMDCTLSNWTLHGQNLGKMLRNYKRQYRDLSPNQCRELGHFFNTKLAVLDTIGNMTENSILHSVQFDKMPLTGGGYDNAPQLQLPPTDINLSRYAAFFPDYQLDNGNVLEPNPTFGSAIFSLEYPHTQTLRNFAKIWLCPLWTRNTLLMTILPQTRV